MGARGNELFLCKISGQYHTKQNKLTNFQNHEHSVIINEKKENSGLKSY